MSDYQLRTPAGPFGVALDQFRRQVRLSHSRLADRSGVDRSFISRLISGDRVPSRDMVLRLAGAMDLSDLEREALLRSAGFSPDPDLPTVLFDVLAERARQDAKWGVQEHSWPEWLLILTEEVGEAAQEANAAHWRGHRVAELRAELIQVAAVAVQIVEAIDRAADNERRAA